jgi:hypothetical protein
MSENRKGRLKCKAKCQKSKQLSQPVTAGTKTKNTGIIEKSDRDSLCRFVQNHNEIRNDY